MDDKQFANHFVAVLGVLIGVTVVILIIARILSGSPQEPDQAMQEATVERLKPIGEIYLATPSETPVTQKVDAPTLNKQISPEEVYNTVCAVCHATGVANAPIYGNKATWASRLGDIEALYTNSLNGKAAMPAKGGRPDLSDETIKATVDYMLESIR